MENPKVQGWIDIFDKSLQIRKENGINDPINLKPIKTKKKITICSRYQNAL